MTVARASGNRIRLTTRSGRSFFLAKSVVTVPSDGGSGLSSDRGFYAISESMVPQIPYTAIGIGIAVIFGVWAFIVAETVKEQGHHRRDPRPRLPDPRPVFPSRPAGSISLVGWMLYGIGCIIYLRLNGMEIR